ncbi:hypothetical protein GUJ93_ZPchr0013g37403 [Zizania palustris]|uniref:Exostosin GT47 domain-containing protein n=1 Tax=Zizania palustris TaxID=103762 RepID=A0A8J6BUU4_ZIZPA|nr:hypothetical protein GUJ93_ZPchr0013g37403 [Zizania palustris]
MGQGAYVQHYSISMVIYDQPIRMAALRSEDTYSMGIRQKLATEFDSTPDKLGNLEDSTYTTNVTVTYLQTDKYYEELASSIFCGVLPRDGWSGRMEDNMLQGCIPVIIQDGFFFFPMRMCLITTVLQSAYKKMTPPM